MSASDELTDGRGSSARPPVAPEPSRAAVRCGPAPTSIARFLSVGGIAFVVDLGLFNLLRFGPGRPARAQAR